MTYPKQSDNVCPNCLNYFTMKRKRDASQIFCGRKCATTYLKFNKETRKCLICNIQFQTSPCVSQNYRFCSRNCANKSRRVIHLRTCNFCKKEFILKNIAYERRGSGKFCSPECGTRIYSFNQEYFEKIDTQDKAYWLGMLLSDGNVYKNQMTLKLQRCDKSLLEKFKKSLDSEHPIHDGISLEGYEFSSFFIGSKKLCNQLQTLGVVPTKTHIVKFPEIDDKLVRHFIRGYFDGDGCMYVGKKHYSWSIYSASEEFIKKLHSTIESATGIKFNLYKNTIILNRGQDIISLKKYLYDDALIFLERKRDKFLKAISYINRS